MLPSSSSEEQKEIAAADADFSFRKMNNATRKEQEENPPEACEARMKYWESARGHDLFGSWTQPTTEEEEEEELKKEQAAAPKDDNGASNS